MKRFENKQDSYLWIMEQIPGISSSYDATWRLEQEKFFPSYNIPSQEEIYFASGYVPLAEESDRSSYTETARAKIFKEKAKLMKNITEIRDFMHSNDY